MKIQRSISDILIMLCRYKQGESMMKKIIAIITTVLMIATIFPMAVSAESPTYTLVDDDVEVSDGLITNYHYSGGGIEPKDIVIPNNLDGQTVVGMGGGAFESKSLTSVIIPDNVIFIGLGAFDSNVFITITLPTPVMAGYTFVNWSDTAVPIGTHNGGDSVTDLSLRYRANFIETVLSTEATLSNLTINEGTLDPSFSSDIISYSVNVTSSISSIDITPTVTESHATLTVNGNAATSGGATAVALNEGANPIPIVVTAEDGTTTSTYTITITRSAPDTVSPQILSLTPADNSYNTLENNKPTLKLKLSEKVKVGTGNISIYKTENDQRVESIDITSGSITGWGTDTIDINTANGFTEGVDYYLLMDSGCLLDESNNPFAGIITKEQWNFTVALLLYKHDSTINQDYDYFMTMYDIAVDDDGNIYASDSEMVEERILKFKSTGELLTSWEVEYPRGVAIDSENNVYVVVSDKYDITTEGSCIKKFTNTGELIATIGGAGSGDGQFEGPTGIAIDSNNNIYVVDTYNYRIQKFDYEGSFLGEWGVNGTGNGEFNEPTAIAIDSKDNVYVVDTYNYRIQKFTNSGTFITTWGTRGSLIGEFSLAEGIATDSDDNVYVTDYDGYNYCRMQKFDSKGNFITLIDFDKDSQAKGIDVDENGGVYIGEYGTMYINKYTPIVQSSESSSGKSTKAKVVTIPAYDGDNHLRVDVMVKNKNIDGKKITVITIEQKSLEKFVGNVEKQEEKGTFLQIEAPEDSDGIVGRLTGEMVKMMEEKDIMVKVITSKASYNLPVKYININEVAKQLGENIVLEDIEVEIEIKEPTEEDFELVKSKTKAEALSIVVPPVEFIVKCNYKGKIIEIEKYVDYVERRILLPDDVDYNKITTAIVYDLDGRVRHIPTKVTSVDGQYYAIINSMTNSIYTLVFNEEDFDDINGHWAEEDIKDMTSRLVIEGETKDLFSPNKNITRAEFAKLVIRTLGLKPEEIDIDFEDVAQNKDVYAYICEAYSCGFIKGFSEREFKPNETITRLEAMVITARLMCMIGYDMDITDKQIEEALKQFDESVADWAKQGIAAVINYEIVKGYDEKLYLEKTITKAEATVLLRRVLKNFDLIE